MLEWWSAAAPEPKAVIPREMLRILVIMMVIASTAAHAELRSDALALAIAHFDPTHERGIDRNGPEFQHIANAITAAVRRYPELRGVHVKIKGWDFPAGHADELRVAYATTSRLEAREPPKHEELLEIAERICGGCLEVTRTVEKGQRTYKHRQWIFRDEQTSKLCKNESAISWLKSMRINEMVLVDAGPGSGLYLVADFVDIAAVLKRMKSEDNYQQLFGSIDLRIAGEEPAPDEPTIQIEPSKYLPDLESPIVFRFRFGWRECPTGCLTSYDWIVKCTPTSKPAAQWGFEVALLGKEASPLREGDELCADCELITGQ